MNYLFSIIFILFSASTAELEHDIHVSVTDIDISESGVIDVTVKVFLDDLMNSLGLEPGAELPDDYSSSDELIKKFMEDNISLVLNGGEPIVLTLEDTTPSMPAVWINMSGKFTEQVDAIKLENKILVELFEDQSNMVNIEVEGKKYSELLDDGQTIWELKPN